jgi:hypothetical protein
MCHLPVNEIVEGIKHGVRKVNIDTDLRMASTGAVRKHLIENTANFDPRKFLKEATNAMSDICAARFEAFGSAGNADKIKVSSLDTMSQRYLSGELEAVFSIKCLRTAPVDAIRKSVSILTLRTPCLMPSTISFTGTP